MRPTAVHRLSDTGTPLVRVDPYEGKTGVAKDLAVIYDIVCGGWISLLLLCLPLGFASEYMGWGAVATFSLVRRICPGDGRPGQPRTPQLEGCKLRRRPIGHNGWLGEGSLQPLDVGSGPVVQPRFTAGKPR